MARVSLLARAFARAVERSGPSGMSAVLGVRRAGNRSARRSPNEVIVRLPLTLLMVATLLVPAGVLADERLVLAHLPIERRAEIMAALRVELAGRATLLEGDAPTDEATDASMRASAADATHVMWIAFPGGMLEPAEVRVLDVARTSAARARTPQAWDVVDPRVVAVLAASLLEPAPPIVVITPVAEAPPAPVPAPPEAAPAPPASEPAPSALALAEPQLGGPRPPRTFSLWLGLGVAHTTRPGLPSSSLVLGTGQAAFYARLTEWASIGLRLRVAGGASSIEGAIIEASIGAPSLAVSFREPLGTAAMIELGVHAEGGLFVSWQENRTRGEDQLSFGIGAGAFVALELGAANGLLLDYTIEIYGLGGVDTWLWGAATLAYLHRWN